MGVSGWGGMAADRVNRLLMRVSNQHIVNTDGVSVQGEVLAADRISGRGADWSQ